MKCRCNHYVIQQCTDIVGASDLPAHIRPRLSIYTAKKCKTLHVSDNGDIGVVCLECGCANPRIAGENGHDSNVWERK